MQRYIPGLVRISGARSMSLLLLMILVLCVPGCPSNGNKRAFIDDYLGNTKLPGADSTADDTEYKGGRSILDSVEADLHPEMIRDLVLPKHYFNDDNLVAKLRIARAYLLKGIYGLAEEELLKSLRVKPDDGYASFLLALAYQGLRDERKEELMLLRTLKLKSNTALANYNLGCLSLKKGKEVAALHYFDECLKENPLIAGASYNKAIIAMRWNKFDIAVKFLEIANSVSPNDFETLNNLGISCERCGKYSEAEGYYLEACRLRPESGDILENLSAYYMSTGRTQMALDIVLRWRKIDQYNMNCLYRLACISSIKGNFEKTSEMLRDAIDCGFKDFNWMSQDPDLAPFFEKYPEFIQDNK